MHTAFFLLLTAVGPPGQPPQFATDTVIPVERGSRLRINNMGGDIVVRAWDRSQLRIQADHSRRAELSIDRRGSVIDVSARGRYGTPSTVDYQVTVPTWMALELGGLNAEVSVEGTRAPVRVETVQGSISLRGGAESVTLSTANGSIDVAGARGRLDLKALSGSIRAVDIEADVVAESVSGDVELRNVTARSVEAQSVSGDLLLTGAIAEGGTYSLFTHSGNITLGIPERSNALLTLSSASGEFRLGFEMRPERTTRRRQTFRLGNGGATIELETFSGDIRVVRPEDVGSQRDGPRRRAPWPRVRIGFDHDRDSLEER